MSFNISVDGVGAPDEFLRDGTKWDKKQKVFDKIFTLSNLQSGQALCMYSIVSAFQVKRNVEWFLKDSCKYVNKHNGVTFNPIVDSGISSVSWLDDDLKDYIRQQVQECIVEFDMNKDEQQWFDLLHSELNKTQTDERKVRYANDFVRAELALNKIRGTDTVDIEPNATKIF